MKIRIEYFAALREQRGLSHECIETSLTTPAELFEELKKKYQFSFDKDHLKVAINEEYAHFDTPLSDSDILVFIPPVAGG